MATNPSEPQTRRTPAGGGGATVPNRLSSARPTSRQTDYNPSAHRMLRHPTTYFETLVHMLKASIGTGVLASPHAFSKSGYVVGIIGTAIIGCLCTYCTRTIVLIQYELCRRNMKPSMTYMETAQMAMLEGPKCCTNFRYMACITNSLILIFQIGCACIYLIFVAKNMQQVITYYFGSEYDLHCFMAGTVVALIAAATISNFKFLATLSFTANVATIVSFILLGICIFKGNPTFENRKRVGALKDLPLFIGTVVFSMEAIGAVIPLENEMRNPARFTEAFGVLHVAMFPTVILYILVGLLGYLNFGDDIKGSITLNLHDSDPIANASKLLMVFGIFSTDVLVLFITYEIIWKSYIMPGDEFPFRFVIRWLCEYMLRLLLIFISYGFAVLVPNLELLISLIGSFSLATAGIAFPALLNLFTYWHDYEGCSFIILFAWCTFIITLGGIACVIGVGTSLQRIYEECFVSSSSD